MLDLTAPDLPFPEEWVPSVFALRSGGEDPSERSGELDEDLYLARDPTSSSTETAPCLGMQKDQGAQRGAVE